MLDGLKKILEIPEDKVKDVESYLQEAVKPNPEGVEQFLESEEGRKILQPRLDKYFSKGLETWKEKTLPDEIEREISKRFPAETEEQKRLRALEKELESEKTARMTEYSRNKALTIANQKGLPVELIDSLVTNDEKETIARIEQFSNIWAASIEKAVEEKFKAAGRNVAESASAPADLREEISAAENAGDWKKAMALKNKLFSKSLGG